MTAREYHNGQPIKVGDRFTFNGDPMTVVKIFPPYHRDPRNYRCSYLNGHCVDLRASELRTGRTFA